MSSTIVHNAQSEPDAFPAASPPEPSASERNARPGDPARHPFLSALGERVRALRAQRGMTRKMTARAADISERHLAKLEYGVGNASILVLQQLAQALHCPLAELIGDITTSSPEWLLLRAQLERCDEAALRRVRSAVSDLMGSGAAAGARSRRIALIGLRGAGKSTLGRRLAEDLAFPFVELSREIERIAGCSTDEIQALYGQNAYRRYERRALEQAVETLPEAVIATPGGLVSDAGTLNLLLTHCTTVWLQAAPEDHMKRVLAQGDTRPMAASREAMEDLKGILAGRAAFYSKAHLQLNTSTLTLEAASRELKRLVRAELQGQISAERLQHTA